MPNAFEELVGREIDDLFSGSLILTGGREDAAEELLLWSVRRAFRAFARGDADGDVERWLEARLARDFLEIVGRLVPRSADVTPQRFHRSLQHAPDARHAGRAAGRPATGAGARCSIGGSCRTQCSPEQILVHPLDVIDADLLRAGVLAGPVVGAASEAFLVHPRPSRRSARGVPAGPGATGRGARPWRP